MILVVATLDVLSVYAFCLEKRVLVYILLDAVDRFVANVLDVLTTRLEMFVLVSARDLRRALEVVSRLVRNVLDVDSVREYSLL